eukprot:6203685-Pleurochrysis_carterae.AAC.9
MREGSAPTAAMPELCECEFMRTLSSARAQPREPAHEASVEHRNHGGEHSLAMRDVIACTAGARAAAAPATVSWLTSYAGRAIPSSRKERAGGELPNGEGLPARAVASQRLVLSVLRLMSEAHGAAAPPSLASLHRLEARSVHSVAANAS